MNKIRKFSIKNFKGFEKEFVFDLSKAGDYCFNSEHVINGIVNKGIIYGKNGTGKSNLGYAMYEITSHLIDNPNGIKNFYLNNYLNLNSNEKMAIFSYEFDFDGDIVNYIYGKKSVFDLQFERLFVNDIKVLDYDYNNTNNNYINIKGIENLRIDLMTNKLSIIKYIYKNTPEDKSSPIYKLINFVEKMLWFRCLNDGNDFIGTVPSVETMDSIIIKYNKLNDFQKFLKKYELEYDLQIGVNESGKELIYAKYKNKSVPLFQVASSGTRAIWLYYCWSIFFDNVSFLFLDEFDAYYHYEAAALIMKAITDKINMQSIVTSHNTYLMKNSMTRPDCCFIISNNQIKPLCDCTVKEIREAHNLEKMYRNGAFQD